MKSKLTASRLNEKQYAEWNDFVAASSSGSIYSTPEYLDVLCSAAGGRFSLLGVFQHDSLVGGLALYESAYPLGSFVSNRLLLYYNGIVLRDFHSRYPSEVTSKQIKILSCLEGQLRALPYGRVLLHNRHPLQDVRPFLQQGWSAAPSYTYEVAVDDLVALWERVDKNTRRLVSRCRNEDVVLSEDDDFGSFYALHESTSERKDSALYLDKHDFEKYFERLLSLKLCKLYQLKLQSGRSIAAQLVLLGQHPVTHTICAGADAEYLSIGSTPFLRWKVFERLNTLGYKANDLTDAELNPVTRFKSSLGGELKRNTILHRPDSAAYRSYVCTKALSRHTRAFGGAAFRKIKEKRTS